MRYERTLGAKNLGDHFLVGRPVEQLALVAIADAQHLGAICVVTPALAPEIGELQRRHQQLDRAGAIHLLAHDALDVLQHREAERQPRIDAGRFLADHAGAQHQPVRDDLRLGRRFLQHAAGNIGRGRIRQSQIRRDSSGMPSNSSKPSARLRFCIACVAAPLRRLSSVATTTTRLPPGAIVKPPISA